MDAIATDERDANEVEEDLSDYQGVLDDDLTEEEMKDQMELWSRQRNIRYLQLQPRFWSETDIE